MTTKNSALTLVDIHELVRQIGVPYDHVSDSEIRDCLQKRCFLATHCIYNGNNTAIDSPTYDLLRIATIVNEIENNTYDDSYPLTIWDDAENDEEHVWDTDDIGHHHIRACYFCNKNIPMAVYRSG